MILDVGSLNMDSVFEVLLINNLISRCVLIKLI